MIQQRVIRAYEEEKNRSKLPGYVPSYDDFEPEVVAPPRAPTTTQIQGAEKPHGPHKLPSQQQQPAANANTQPKVVGFGAGVFD